MNKYIYPLLFALLFISCKKDELSNPLDRELNTALRNASKTGEIDHFILPSSTAFSKIPQDPHNPLNQDKVNLGKQLFYETGLALAPMHNISKESYSCSSCHIPSAGFMPCRVQGIADGGLGFGVNGEKRTALQNYDETELDVQGARPLSLINVAFVQNTGWNGQFGGNGINEGTEALWDLEEVTKVNHEGFFGLESQNIEGLDLHRMVVNKEVTDEYGYTPMFDAAFGDRPEDERYNFETASFAISAYLRTLFSNEAPFQQWLKGDLDAMSTQQKRGAVLFFTKAGCANCHNGTSLNNPDYFYALGVKDLYETGEVFNTDIDDRRNKGRGGFTQDPEDLYKFKVPQLYNMRFSPFYFHGSSKRTLREVVEYFNEGVPENANVPDEQIAPFFRPLQLTDVEIDAIVSFLEEGLYDPAMSRYVPESVLSGNCFPNNDPFSQIELGCK